MLFLFIRQKKSQIKINWKLFQCAIYPRYFVILLNSLLQKRIKHKINHLYHWKKNFYLFRNVTYESWLTFTKISPFFLCCIYAPNNIDLFQHTHHCIRMNRVGTAEATACSSRHACKRYATYSIYAYVHMAKIQRKTLAISTTAIYNSNIFFSSKFPRKTWDNFPFLNTESFKNRRHLLVSFCCASASWLPESKRQQIVAKIKWWYFFIMFGYELVSFSKHQF